MSSNVSAGCDPTQLLKPLGHFFCFKRIDKMPDDAHIAQIWHHLGLRTDFSHIYMNLYQYVLPLLLIIGPISAKPWVSFIVSI